MEGREGGRGRVRKEEELSPDSFRLDGLAVVDSMCKLSQCCNCLGGEIGRSKPVLPIVSLGTEWQEGRRDSNDQHF